MRNPGAYRYPITIERYVTAADGQGGATVTSTPEVIQTWARLEQTDASTNLFNGEMSGRKFFTLIVRYRSDLNESVSSVYARSYRLKYNGKQMNIEGIRDLFTLQGVYEVEITASMKV